MVEDGSQETVSDETGSIIGPSPPELSVNNFTNAVLESEPEPMSSQTSDRNNFYGFRVSYKRKSCSQESDSIDLNTVDSKISAVEECLKENSIIEFMREKEKKVNEMLQEVLNKVQARDEGFQEFLKLIRSNNSSVVRSAAEEDFALNENSREKLEKVLKALKERVDYFLSIQAQVELCLHEASEKFKEMVRQFNANAAEVELRISTKVQEFTKLVKECSGKFGEIEQKLPKVALKSFVIQNNGENDYKFQFGPPKLSGLGTIELNSVPQYKRKQKVFKKPESSQSSIKRSPRSQNLSESQLASLRLRATETLLLAKRDNKS